MRLDYGSEDSKNFLAAHDRSDSHKASLRLLESASASKSAAPLLTDSPVTKSDVERTLVSESTVQECWNLPNRRGCDRLNGEVWTAKQKDLAACEAIGESIGWKIGLGVGAVAGYFTRTAHVGVIFLGGVGAGLGNSSGALLADAAYRAGLCEGAASKK